MNLCRCDKGHFYDREKYASCPHCAKGVDGDEGLTTVFTEEMDSGVGVTEAVDDFVANPVPGAAVPNPAPITPVPGAAASNPTLVTAGASIPNPTPVTAGAGAAIPNPVPVTAGAGAAIPNPIPVTAGAGAAIPNPTPVTAGVGAGSLEPDDEDDDHTVAFYDDIFAAASPTPVSDKAATISASSDATAGAVSALTSGAVSAPVPQTEPAPAKSPVRVSTPCVGWLIALNNVHVGQDFRLKTGKNFIGRDSKMDIVLDGDKSVSRNKHAVLVYEPKQHLYMIQPGESSELVYLNNDVVLSPMKLSAYDVVTLGEVRLLFMPLCGEKFNWTDELKKKQV